RSRAAGDRRGRGCRHRAAGGCRRNVSFLSSRQYGADTSQGRRRSRGESRMSAPSRYQGKLLDKADVADLARGCAFLGSGGGGDPHTTFMEIEAALAGGGAIELIDLDALCDDAFIAPCGWIGAPTISVEKLPSGREA